MPLITHQLHTNYTPIAHQLHTDCEYQPAHHHLHPEHLVDPAWNRISLVSWRRRRDLAEGSLRAIWECLLWNKPLKFPVWVPLEKGTCRSRTARELNFYIIFESIYINLYLIQLPHSLSKQMKRPNWFPWKRKALRLAAEQTTIICFSSFIQENSIQTLQEHFKFLFILLTRAQCCCFVRLTKHKPC